MPSGSLLQNYQKLVDWSRQAFAIGTRALGLEPASLCNWNANFRSVGDFCNWDCKPLQGGN